MDCGGIALEERLWHQPGTRECYGVMAGKRAAFHREFGIEPTGFFSAEKHPMGFPTAVVAVYEIPDIVERTRSAPQHFEVDRVSETAHFTLLNPLPSDITVISQQFGSASLGIVSRLSPLPFGVIVEGERLWRANEAFDDTLQHALEEARKRRESTEGYVTALANFFRELGGAPAGSCFPKNYVLVDGDIMLRSTTWKESSDVPSPDISAVINQLLTPGERTFFDRLLNKGRPDGRFLSG